MKSYFSILLCISCSVIGRAQSEKPDFCDFLDRTINTVSLSAYLKIDTMNSSVIKLFDIDGRFSNCKKTNIHNRTNFFVLTDVGPKDDENYYNCSYRTQDQGYSVDLWNKKQHVILQAFIKQKKGVWVISEVEGGIMD